MPDRPLCEPEPRGTDGLAIQHIKIPKGELSSAHLARIAELAEMYGDKHVYSTNRQNLELHGVVARAAGGVARRDSPPWAWKPTTSSD